MNAIRQVVEVKNHKLDIQLPADFDAEYAEVIIFPKEEENDFFVSDEEKELMRERLINTDENNFEPWEDIKKKYL